MQILDTPLASPPSKPIWNTVLRYGLLGGIVLVVGAQVLYHLQVYSINWSGMIANALMLLAINASIAYLGIKRQRDQLDGGFITIGKAISISLLSIFIGFSILDIWNYLFINFIEPDYLDNLKSKMVAMWQNQVSPEDLAPYLAEMDSLKNLGDIFKNSLKLEMPLGMLSGVAVSLFMVRKNNP